MMSIGLGDSRLPPRFWAKVDENGPVPIQHPDMGRCWQWVGSRTNNGYGQIWDGGRLVLAHRLAYETLVGPIPDGLECDHLCRNRPCVRPSHIEPVTHSANLKRSPFKGQAGEANRNAKLTEAQVREIRWLRGTVSQRKLAALFGVNHSHICHVQTGYSWSSVA